MKSPYEIILKREGHESEGNERRWTAYAKVAPLGERRGHGATPQAALASVVDDKRDA